jgi:lipopolysaccharide export system protein LptA
MPFSAFRFAASLCLALVVGVWVADPVAAQGAKVAFGGIKADPTLPVEVTADQLAVDQEDGEATFTGNVLIIQGEMRMTAATVRVEYAPGDGSRIARMLASGGVTLVSGAEAAEARDAEYTIESGVVVMRGDVLLTQGSNAISGQSLTVDLTTGTGVMEGRVKTVLNPGGN